MRKKSQHCYSRIIQRKSYGMREKGEKRVRKRGTGVAKRKGERTVNEELWNDEGGGEKGKGEKRVKKKEGGGG